MKVLRNILLVISLVFLISSSALAAIPERPTKDIYVQDYAGLLSEATKSKVLTIGKELNAKTTAQIAVVTVATLDDRPISEYANDLFRKWGIGSKEKNNGVLLLISQNPRKLRIEVGYGLEGALPDGYTGRVRDECLVPHLKKDDYDSGVVAAYQELALKTAKEYQATLESVKEESTLNSGSEDENSWEGFGYAMLFLAIIVVIMYLGGAFICWLIDLIFGKTSGTSGNSSSDNNWSSSSSDDSFGGGDSGGGGSEGDY